MKTQEISEKPYFDNGFTKWYFHKNLQNYIESEQADNLPVLLNLYCFVVKGKGVNDIVLIDGNQNILATHNNTLEGENNIKTRIIAHKVNKHFTNDNL